MSNDERVQEIIDRLQDLAIESVNLTDELRRITRAPPTARHPSPPPPPPPPEPQPRARTNAHSYVVGDYVVITNNYKWKRGTRGIVTHVSPTQVTLLDEQGETHTRKHTNIGYAKKAK